MNLLERLRGMWRDRDVESARLLLERDNAVAALDAVVQERDAAMAELRAINEFLDGLAVPVSERGD